METWIDIAGVTVRAPVTAFMNLVLATQCTVYATRLHSEADRRRKLWSLFFLAMAIATAAGAPKHGLRHVLSADLYGLVLWVSCLGSGVAVYFAQKATIVSYRDPLRERDTSRADGAVDRVGALCALQAGVYLCAAVLVGPEMWLTVANTAVGLTPVMAAEARAALRGRTGGSWVACGLGVSMLTGVVYLVGVSFGAWFNHIDIAHTLMVVSFWMILRGAADSVDSADGRWMAATSTRQVVAGSVAKL